MPSNSSRAISSLKAPAAVVLSVFLVAQAAAYYAIPKTETSFSVAPLAEFPKQIDSWTSVAEYPVESEVQAVLKATDSLNRSYSRPGSAAAVNLFVAFFRSQATGVAPHSPKNCLPGSGYAPLSSGTVNIAIPALGQSIEVNRYVVAKGDVRTLVLYWYQTPKRIVASEYAAKFWLAADSIRYHRSDTSLVRIVVPINGVGEERADALATMFIQSALPALNRQLPRL
ncbi:MAG: EpsI family protein [Acidobacteria bacterium]|nr:EpsI family protein [Acidobacteriota bacterium]